MLIRHLILKCSVSHIQLLIHFTNLSSVRKLLNYFHNYGLYNIFVLITIVYILPSVLINISHCRLLASASSFITQLVTSFLWLVTFVSSWVTVNLHLFIKLFTSPYTFRKYSPYLPCFPLFDSFSRDIYCIDRFR